MSLSAPEPLNGDHDVSQFSCGQESMDRWLQNTALKSQAAGGAKTYVACDNGRFIGYYALSAGSVCRQETTGRFRRNMPDPILVVLLGRLAVDQTYQRQGIARNLMRDAFHRVLGAAEEIGIRGILVHALDDEARDFYIALGFEPSPINANTLFMALQDIQQAII